MVLPKPDTENVIRWFVNLGGSIYWEDSLEELTNKYRHLVVEDEDDFKPKSFVYSYDS